MKPSVNLNSRKHLARQISGPRLSEQDARELIDFVCNPVNHSNLWRDNLAESNEEKGKWVRDASWSKLGILLKLINSRVLAPQDRHLPHFIFGGRTGMSNVHAVHHLMGYKKQRTLLALDITRFFESVDIKKVDDFFMSADCSNRMAKTLSKACCVPVGKKYQPEGRVSLARGFSTSTRLAVWSYINAFYEINDLAMKRLKDYDPRVAIYIDDIGISASRVPEDLLRSLESDVDSILKKASNSLLKLNRDKTDVKDWNGAIEHMGVKLNRNSLVLPKALQKKLDRATYLYIHEKEYALKQTRKGLLAYRGFIKKISSQG